MKMKRRAAVAAVLAAFAVGAAEVPFCALRSGAGVVSPANWPKVHEALAANPGAFDEIWFSTGITYPPLDWHREQSRRCADAAEDLKKLGIVASLEIQMTIGHGDGVGTNRDDRALDWQRWVGWDGTAARICSCPRAPGLRDYFRSVAAIYAGWHPGCIWIDDDLRMNNRAPSKGSPNRPGCWCPSCLAAFSETEGRTWTRETLLAAIVGGDAALEGRWRTFQAQGLADLAKAIAEEVRRVSPETVMGSEFGGGIPEVIRALYAGSGRKVRVRPGAGCYWDTNPHQQISKAHYAAAQIAALGCDEIIEAVIPETETCPRTFSCRTPQGVILEAFEHLACGADALSLFVADTRMGEDWNFYRDRMFRRIAAARGFLLGYRHANEGTLPCGFTVEDGPQDLVACRGIPIVTGRAKALGPLPDIRTISVRGGGAVWQARDLHPDTLAMQMAAGPDLMAFAKRADESCGNRTPVMFDSPVMAWVQPHVSSDGRLRTVAVLNASIDVQEPVRVRLRGVPEGASVEWRPLHGAAKVLAPSREGAEVSVELPAIPAWDCGYVFIAKEECHE